MTECRECKYWVVDSGRPWEGDCRRKSPLPIMTAPNPDNRVMFNAVWPITQSTDCCGEGEPLTP